MAIPGNNTAGILAIGNFEKSIKILDLNTDQTAAELNVYIVCII